MAILLSIGIALLIHCPAGVPESAICCQLSQEQNTGNERGAKESPIDEERQFHYGKDYAGEVGDDVFAMYDGIVSKVGPSKDLGSRLVRLTCTLNGKKWFVDYGHLSSVTVAIGEAIRAGARIGSMGRDGILPGIPTHVHIQIWRYVDKGVRGFVKPRWDGEER
jgi:murein DD-endopeptidase MepM/ murein hydrolase activator NlpD